MATINADPARAFVTEPDARPRESRRGDGSVDVIDWRDVPPEQRSAAARGAVRIGSHGCVTTGGVSVGVVV